MPGWPINLLLKLFAEPRVAIGGGVATAEAFLPSRGDAPAIRIGSVTHPRTRSTARRWARRPTSRRRLTS